MTAFAEPDELADLLGASVDPVRAMRALIDATAAITAEADHAIEKKTGDVKLLAGSWRPVLQLPEPPVLAVTEVVVTLDGQSETLGEDGFRFTRRGKVYRASHPLNRDEVYGSWGGPLAEIRVTYDHGYEVVPPELKGLCLRAAARNYVNPTGVDRESIGTYSVGYGRLAELLLTDDEKQVCHRYRTPLE